MTAVDQTHAAPIPAPTPAAYEPRIVAFLCKWCTYAGADLAGTSRLTYPPNVRAIMLPCTGRIDISFVVRAFLQGADGVLVSGCHPGDCHYTAGNFRARRRWILLRSLLDVLGFDLRRLDLAWISAAEGAKWVKTIQTFTDKIKTLGPYDPLRAVADNHTPVIAPPAHSPVAAPPAPSATATPSPDLVNAIADSLRAGRVKAVVGCVKTKTLRRPRPAWIISPEAAADLSAPVDGSNLARLLKNPELKTIRPLGLIARAAEVMSLNVLAQESQVDPASFVLFAIGNDGVFRGEMSLDEASAELLAPHVKSLPAARPAGFSDETLRALDDLLAKPPHERWAFWGDQSAKCLKCYACRGSCPLCNCDQCFVDRNQPQWFPTASDGPGNFSWHLLRAFHLAGRCVGCGACQAACPVGIPLNILSAAAARAALENFDHRAGLDPRAIPLQCDFKPDDHENFIL